MPQIIPIKELRNTSKISQICHDNEEPIYITKNGYGDMVLMSMETYEKKMALADLVNKISEGEKDLQTGDLIAADEALKSLREEFFGTKI